MERGIAMGGLALGFWANGIFFDDLAAHTLHYIHYII